MVFQVKVGSEGHKRYKRSFPRLSRNERINQTQPSRCWQEVKDDVDDNTNHQRARKVFLTMNSRDISEEATVLTVIMTNFVERLYEDAIEQRRHQAKGIDEAEGYWIHGYGASSKSSLLFEVK
jgi:hypothetical protein